jgi:nicotinate-nucleotide pyrophosphorylase (carboxylating)
VVLEAEGDARALLSAERTALNFLQLLSAVATKTATYVEAVAARAPTSWTRARPSRPAPGAEVRRARGRRHQPPHRPARRRAHQGKPHCRRGRRQRRAAGRQRWPRAQFIEIEVETLEQLREALDAGAKMVLLDNMPLPMLREAVRINAGRAILEISGGVTLDGLRALAETGVDRISIGALTKDVKATDFSMRLEELP